MRFDCLTLFPQWFEPLLQHGITRRAFAGAAMSGAAMSGAAMSGAAMQLRLWDLRGFGVGVHRAVDDRPFGGGPGMVLAAPPLRSALAAIRADRAAAVQPSAPVIVFSPGGERLTQSMARQFAADARGAILVCGRYEGIDERFIEHDADRQISLGDFVLSGGEIPALALLDAVARLLPGTLHEGSAQSESFSEGDTLDYPQYTRPENLQGQSVPPILLSGNHQAIAAWRQAESERRTRERRRNAEPAAGRRGV